MVRFSEFLQRFRIHQTEQGLHANSESNSEKTSSVSELSDFELKVKKYIENGCRHKDKTQGGPETTSDVEENRRLLSDGYLENQSTNLILSDSSFFKSFVESEKNNSIQQSKNYNSKKTAEIISVEIINEIIDQAMMSRRGDFASSEIPSNSSNSATKRISAQNNKSFKKRRINFRKHPEVTQFDNNPFFRRAEEISTGNLQSRNKVKLQHWFLVSLRYDMARKNDLAKFKKWYVDYCARNKVSEEVKTRQFELLGSNNLQLFREFQTKRLAELQTRGLVVGRTIKDQFFMNPESFYPRIIWNNNSCAFDTSLSVVQFIAINLIHLHSNEWSLFSDTKLPVFLCALSYRSSSTTRSELYSNMVRNLLFDCYEILSNDYNIKIELQWNPSEPGNPLQDLFDSIYHTFYYLFSSTESTEFKFVTIRLSPFDMKNFVSSDSLNEATSRCCTNKIGIKKYITPGKSSVKLLFCLVRLPEISEEEKEKIGRMRWNNKAEIQRCFISSIIGISPHRDPDYDHFVSVSTTTNDLSNSEKHLFYDGMLNGGRVEDISGERFGELKKGIHLQNYIKIDECTLICIIRVN